MKLDPKLAAKIDKALKRGDLLESSASNIGTLLGNSSSELYSSAVAELVEMEKWSELNDRFYKTLAFGTGGLRGRTIGKIVTKAERGTPTNDRPSGIPLRRHERDEFLQHQPRDAGTGRLPAMESSVALAASQGHRKLPMPDKPKIVIAHDTRFFSKEFAELAARVAAENGCDACVFDGPRSTPELSFAVRHLRASAGIVITASHNPPHDNGYKVYFNDGAQVVEPHASGIIAQGQRRSRAKRSEP